MKVLLKRHPGQSPLAEGQAFLDLHCPPSANDFGLSAIGGHAHRPRLVERESAEPKKAGAGHAEGEDAEGQGLPGRWGCSYLAFAAEGKTGEGHGEPNGTDPMCGYIHDPM